MGDDRADLEARLAGLVAERGTRLLAVAWQLTHDRGAAEDVVQSALERVHRSLARRRMLPDDLEAYVRRAVLHEFLRGRTRRAGEVLVADTPEPSTHPPAFDDAVVDHDALWTALGRLVPRQRAVLVLRHHEGLDDVAIAAVLGCRRATVRSLAARGLAALRAAETADTGGAPPSDVTTAKEST